MVHPRKISLTECWGCSRIFIVKSVVPSSIQRIFDYAQRHLVDLQKGPNSYLNFVDVGMFKTYNKVLK